MQKLQTVNAETLLYEPLEKPSFVVDSLIPTGLSLFCGSQKIGKYFRAISSHYAFIQIVRKLSIIRAIILCQIPVHANLYSCIYKCPEHRVLSKVSNIPNVLILHMPLLTLISLKADYLRIPIHVIFQVPLIHLSFVSLPSIPDQGTLPCSILHLDSPPLV